MTRAVGADHGEDREIKADKPNWGRRVREEE
jgi:hypothetical protein